MRIPLVIVRIWQRTMLTSIVRIAVDGMSRTVVRDRSHTEEFGRGGLDESFSVNGA